MVLDNNSYRVVKYLLNTHTYSTIDMISEELDMSKRSIYYSINTINNLLEKSSIERIISKRYYGVLLENEVRRYLMEEIEKSDSLNQVYLTEHERSAIIVCALYRKRISIEELAELCKVSIRTLQEDIKLLESKLKVFNIEITNKRSYGYQLEGSQIHIRTAVMYYLDIIINLVGENMIEDVWFNNLEQLKNKINQIKKEAQLSFKDHFVQKLAFIVGSNKRNEIIFTTYQNEIVNHVLFKIVRTVLDSYPYDECYYITMIMTSARLAKLYPTLFKDMPEFALLSKLVNMMIHLYEEIGSVSFTEKQNLQDSLIQHIYFSTKLYQYGIIEVNPLKEEIQLEYTSVYNLTKLVLNKIESDLYFPVTDDEIAYIALLFGSHLDLNSSKSVKLLVVCASGVSTSLMIKQEIVSMDNKVDIVATVSTSDFEKYESIVDIIISTVKIDTNKPVVYVNPVFTSTDRTRVSHGIESIKSDVQNEKNYNALYQELAKYVIPGKEEIVQELIKRFEKERRTKIQSNNEISIIDIMDDVTYANFSKVDDWQESIRYAGQGLVRKKLIEDSYLDACIDAIQSNGAYSVFPNNMYLAHAKPKDGVKKLSIAVAKFDHLVVYPGKSEIEFVVVLATTDYNSHIKVLNQIVELFSNKEFIKDVRVMKQNKNEFIEMIGRYIK